MRGFCVCGATGVRCGPHVLAAPGAEAEQGGGDGDADEDIADRVPAAGQVVDHADHERPHGRQGVADALGHARQMRGDVGVARAQDDQRQGDAEGTALAEAEQDRPAPDGLQRRIEEAEQAGEGGRHHQHHRQALVPGASGEPGREQGGDQLQHHRAGQHQAGFYRSHAAVDQDRRQPTEDDVGQGRLQAHVQRDLPGQRVAPQADDTEGLAMGVLALAGLRQPEGGGEDRRQRPERQRQFPVAEELLQRRGSAGGERCAQAQGHGVDPGHHPGLAREVAFDDARQEHADDADAGAGQDAAGEQAEHREQAAQDDAAGQAEEDQQHAAFGADTPGQARRERREQPQAEYRRGGQQAGGGGREAGIVAYLVEQGARLDSAGRRFSATSTRPSRSSQGRSGGAGGAGSSSTSASISSSSGGWPGCAPGRAFKA